MQQPLSEGQRLVTSLHSALRITQDPQDPRRYTEVLDNGVVPEKIRRWVIPLRAIQGLGVFQVRPGKRELPLESQRFSLVGVRLYEHKGVLSSLPKLEKLTRQSMHRLMVGSHKEEDVDPINARTRSSGSSTSWLSSRARRYTCSTSSAP